MLITSACSPSFENKKHQIIKFPSFVYFKVVVYLWKLILDKLIISYVTSFLFTFVFTGLQVRFARGGLSGLVRRGTTRNLGSVSTPKRGGSVRDKTRCPALPGCDLRGSRERAPSHLGLWGKGAPGRWSWSPEGVRQLWRASRGWQVGRRAQA